MKKLILIILILFLIPKTVFATTPVITDTTIEGISDKEVGDTLSLNFLVTLSGIEKDNWDSLGMATVIFEVEFDDTILSLNTASITGWESTISGENGIYAVRSVVLKDQNDNKCIDKVTYCGDYSVTLEFLIKETEKASTDIKIGDVLIGLTPMIDGSKKVADNDIVTIKSSTKEKFTVNIKQDEIKTETFKPINTSNTSNKNNDNFKNFKIVLEEKHYIIGGIVLGVTLVVFIINKISDSKLNKALKKF